MKTYPKQKIGSRAYIGESMGEIHFESHIKYIIYIRDYFRIGSPLLP